MPVGLQVAILHCITQGLFDSIAIDEVKQFEQRLVDHFAQKYSNLISELLKDGDVSVSILEKLSVRLRNITST